MYHKDFKKAPKNSPDVGFENTFTDVSDGSFYKNHSIPYEKNAIGISDCMMMTFKLQIGWISRQRITNLLYFIDK